MKNKEKTLLSIHNTDDVMYNHFENISRWTFIVLLSTNKN
jgi:hypothetical protein